LRGVGFCVFGTYKVLVCGPFDIVARSCVDIGREGIEFDGEICERCGGEEGG
jgi:hypothetical protein